MEEPQRTSKGFIVRRHCEFCGKIMHLIADNGEECTLQCPACHQLYVFYCKAA